MWSRCHCRRAGVAAVLTLCLFGAVAGLTACATGGENPSKRPSTGAPERSVEHAASSEPDATRSRGSDRITEPAETGRPSTTTADVTPEPTRTARTSTPAATTAGPRGSAAVVAPAPTPTTRTSTAPTPADATSAAAATDAAQSPETWGWLLVIVLFAALIVGGWLVYRSQRRSAWDGEARTVESETRTILAIRLPPVLNTTTADQRNLAWPPVQASLTEVKGRWNALTGRAVGEERWNWSLRISGLLQELITAVAAESEALAAGRDWMPLRHRVNRAGQALAAVLTANEQPGEAGASTVPT